MPSARDLSLSGALRGLCSSPDDDPAAYATCEPRSEERDLRILPPQMDGGLLGSDSESDSSVPTPHLGSARDNFRTPAGDAEASAEPPQSGTALERYLTPLESEPSQASASPVRHASPGAAMACVPQISPLTGLPLGVALQSSQQAAVGGHTGVEVSAPADGAHSARLGSKLPRAPKKAVPVGESAGALVQCRTCTTADAIQLLLRPLGLPFVLAR